MQNRYSAYKSYCSVISLSEYFFFADELETPEKAFYRKAQGIILGNFLRLMENMQVGDANEAWLAN